LKGKKLQTRAFAFWELAYIAERFQGRRKVIFEDIDRKGGSAWSQILDVCLETITGIDTRIDEHDRTSTVNGMAKVKKNEGPVSKLPLIGRPLKDGIAKSGDLFESPSHPKSRGAGAYFQTLGQSSPRTSPIASKIMAKAEDVILTPKQKDAVAKDGFPAIFREWAIWFLRTKLGSPFRQEYSRSIVKVVLGSPYGDLGVIVDAIDSLTRLAVCSLQEDKYGNVQRDIKKIIQTLTTTVTKLEKFKTSIGFHWTDVEKKQESPEVDAVLDALKSGLNQLIEAFGDYSVDLRLSTSEMRSAREAAAA